MKSSLFSFFLLPLILTASLTGQAYQELKSYRDLKLTQSNQKTWVIFDIDNTLIHPNGPIGSVEWVEYMNSRYVQAGYTKEKADEKQHELFGMTQMPGNVVPVDSSIYSFLQSLPRNFNVFALTARNPNLMLMTAKQLSSVSLIGTFEAGFPKLKQKPDELAIERGMIFANGRDKGQILELLLQNAQTEPENIIFFDDKLNNVQAFDQAMDRVNLDRPKKIASQSYLFTAAQPLVQQFNPRVADALWYQFRYMKSDVVPTSFARLENPGSLSRALFQEQAPVLATDIQDVDCAHVQQDGNQVTTTCAYRTCERSAYIDDSDNSACVQLSIANMVSYELQYLPDLKIYIRSGWEFLKRD